MEGRVCGGGEQRGEEGGGGGRGMDKRGWYITSKLVQVVDDQIVSRVINRRAAVVLQVKEIRVIINSSLSATLCSVTAKM